jgi:hypothetical protein
MINYELLKNILKEQNHTPDHNSLITYDIHQITYQTIQEKLFKSILYNNKINCKFLGFLTS